MQVQGHGLCILQMSWLSRLTKCAEVKEQLLLKHCPAHTMVCGDMPHSTELMLQSINCAEYGPAVACFRALSHPQPLWTAAAAKLRPLASISLHLWVNKNNTHTRFSQ